MSEAVEKKAEQKSGGEKKAKKPAAVDLVKAEKKTKAAWTLEKCMKAAKRFDTEAQWSAGAPAAYKSATAHGWVAECTAHMTKFKYQNRKSA